MAATRWPSSMAAIGGTTVRNHKSYGMSMGTCHGVRNLRSNKQRSPMRCPLVSGGVTVAAGFSVCIPSPRTIRLAGVCATAVNSLADLVDPRENTSLTSMSSGSTACETGQRKSPFVKSRSALFTVQAWAKPVRLAKSLLWNSFTNSPKTQLPENLPKQVLYKLETTKLLQLSAKHFQASQLQTKQQKHKQGRKYLCHPLLLDKLCTRKTKSI